MNRRPILAAAAALLVAACSGPQPSGSLPPASTSAPPGPAEVTLMTHDSFVISEALLAALEAEHGITLRILPAGDAGQMVNQAILARDAPLADVLFGVDNAFLTRALDAGIFEPYRSPLLDAVPDELEPPGTVAVTPIDYGDVCLNFDRAAFDYDLPADALPPPRTLEDLEDPRYAGLLVVENPATSSPGLAFLLATIERFGESDGPGGGYDWLDYWQDLVDNDVLVVSGWQEAYYGHFSAAGEGDRPIVVSYATSPVAEVLFADPPVEAPPTGVVSDGCFRQVEYAGVLAGTPRSAAAQKVIDFLLGRAFQSELPLTMFVFPANAEAPLPEMFAEHAARIEAPITMHPALIGEQRERWLAEWTDVVLR